MLRIRDVDAALAFCSGVLGLNKAARRDFGEGPMVFLSTGKSHHDLALVDVGSNASGDGSHGLHNVTFKGGDSLTDLTAVKRHLDAHGVATHMLLDHLVSDPDGNLLELYVDADPSVWLQDPSFAANSAPLTSSG